MQGFPKVPDDGSIFGVTAFIRSAFLKFFKVYDIVAMDDGFEILGVKEFDHSAWDDFVEAFFEGIKLFFDLFIKQEVSVELAVLLFVVLCDFDFAAIFYKLFNNFLAEVLKLDGEIDFQILKRLFSLE